MPEKGWPIHSDVTVSLMKRPSMIQVTSVVPFDVWGAALGASNIGVLKIFLGYGLLLGIVGATLGTLLGLGITNNINGIEYLLTKVTGHQIFDRKIYYFNEIPTDVQAWSVGLVNAGAVLIAVIFSVLPALRAALLHPVRALRYE